MFSTLSIPYISSVVPSELVFDDEDVGVDVDSGKGPILKIILIPSIKIAWKNVLKSPFIC